MDLFELVIDAVAELMPLWADGLPGWLLAGVLFDLAGIFLLCWGGTNHLAGAVVAGAVAVVVGLICMMRWHAEA